MKRFDRKTYWLLPALALLVLCLSACGGGLDAQLRPKAEAYLKTLAEKAGVQDSFTLTKDKADTADKADPIAFTAKSETYQKEFTVYVSRDGNTVTDSYYTLSMRDMVFNEGMAMMKAALGEDFPETEVVLVPASQEALSGRTFASLKEFMDASGSLLLLQFYIRGDGKTQLTSEQIDKVLIAMQEKGFRATLYPYISNAVWYDVTPDGIWVTTRTGADGGKMLERKEYTPLTDK
ncbi:MAG: hypothetical protein IJK86_04930 [Lachnospiraceae bacterium]|nr:hypothetical protein [Lachnospiraceae bacterium]